MATSQSLKSSLAEDVDKELTCAICLSRYDRPKVLPCLHTYCMGCLQDLVKKSRKPNQIVRCPQCQEEHQLPDQGIDGFKTYFTINNLLELLQLHEGSETSSQVIQCDNGLDDNPAVARCSACCCYLCETCWTIHKKQVATRNHKVISLDEIRCSDKQTGAKSLQKKQYCEEHQDEVLKLFCKTCERAICRDCALVKPHCDHEKAFLPQIRPEIQQHLQALMIEVQKRETEFRSHKEYVENVRLTNRYALTSCEQAVNKTFNRLSETLEARRATLIAELRNSHETQEKHLNTESDTFELTLTKLSGSIRFTQQLLDNGSDIEVVSMSEQTGENLKKLKETCWDKSTAKPSLMRMKFNPQLEKDVKEFGDMTCTLQPTDIIVKDMPDDVQLNKEMKFTVELSAEVSERGYVSSMLTVKLVHDGCCTESPCKIENTGPNTWVVSCTPQKTGRYKGSVLVDSIEAYGSPMNIAISIPISQLEFPSTQAYYDQLQQSEPDYDQPQQSEPDYGQSQQSEPYYGQSQQSEPDYGQSQQSEPDYGQSQQSEPDYGQSQQSEPDYGQSQQSEPDYGQSQQSEPDYGQSQQSEPDYGQSQQSEPYYGQSQQSEPDYGQSQQSEPDYGQSQQSEPDYGQSQQSEPDYGQSQQSEPYYGQSQQSEPDYGQSQQSEPDYGQSQQSEPDYDQLQQSEPDYGQPQQSEPDYGQPQQSEPSYYESKESGYDQPQQSKPQQSRSSYDKIKQEFPSLFLQASPVPFKPDHTKSKSKPYKIKTSWKYQ